MEGLVMLPITHRSRKRSPHRACFGLAFFFLLASCSAGRKPIAPGTIPRQAQLTPEDLQFGQQTYEELTAQYPIARNSTDQRRVQNIIRRLSETALSSTNPWRSFILQGDELKNAAATKGNFIFVWTGMLNTVIDNDELAAVLAHEIAHVLADHTTPSLTEDAANLASDTASATASGAVAATGGYWGVLAGIGGVLTEGTVDALMLNPELRQTELEADVIGLFLMAEAGYDPNAAIEFWDRIKDLPEFAPEKFQFLSTHPSSKERLEQLRLYLPQAAERYRKYRNKGGFQRDDISLTPDSRASEWRADEWRSAAGANKARYNWSVTIPSAQVFESADSSSLVVGDLPYQTQVTVADIDGRWAEIVDPLPGFVTIESLMPQGR